MAPLLHRAAIIKDKHFHNINRIVKKDLMTVVCVCTDWFVCVN